MYSSASSSAWSPSPTSSNRPRSRSPPPASPARRLRGLSYLRSYTHNHILFREGHSQPSTQRTPAARAAPSPLLALPATFGTVDPPAAPTSAPPILTRQAIPPPRPTTTDLPVARSSDPSNLGSAKGWLPTVGGHSGAVSYTATGAESTATTSSSGLLSVSAQSASSPDSSTRTPRTPSATVGTIIDMPRVDGGGDSHPRNEMPTLSNGNDGSHGTTSHQLPSIRFIAHQDPRAQRPSLVFSPLARILPSGHEVIKVGRYSERDNQPTQAANVPSSAPVGFKSKVVSRRHCEFWCTNNRWYIKDVKSSSGTFLNHIRLSSPGTESRPFPINDGDIVQLGIDFKGGEEMIFRCVKIRVELNKGWQTVPSSFNVQSHKRLQELNKAGKPPASGPSQDCSICLGQIAPCQSLFVAPCSHTWHYKCIRVIINGPHWPHFICPNCRTVADLEAELDDPAGDSEWEELDATDANTGLQTLEPPELSGVTHQTRQIDSSETTHIAPQPVSEELDHDKKPRSNGDVVERKGDLDLEEQVHHTTREIESLNVDEPTIPPRSSSSQVLQSSNATVPPVDITRSPLSPLSTGTYYHPQSPDTRVERNIARTPSPNGLPSSMPDVVPNSEGPMTPRNNAGPFIFDGSAGALPEMSPLQPSHQPAL